MPILTVFFSMKGETITANTTVENLSKGHTAVAAEFINEAVGGDMFEIETIKTYIADHMKMIYEAKDELQQGIRPELKRYPDSLDAYDTIFLGYPNWWGSCLLQDAINKVSKGAQGRAHQRNLLNAL